jgi:hypothetical protein
MSESLRFSVGKKVSRARHGAMAEALEAEQVEAGCAAARQR